jgi:hypothetical protein
MTVEIEPEELPAVMPEKARVAGVLRITGKTEEKRRLNWAIVKAVVIDDVDPEIVEAPSQRGDDKPIGVRQVRRIVALAKGAGSAFDLENAVYYDKVSGRREGASPPSA